MRGDTVELLRDGNVVASDAPGANWVIQVPTASPTRSPSATPTAASCRPTSRSRAATALAWTP
jgi:hypothetical protein